jgi:formylglycine-generating enzyme required for sulfatase activity
MTKFRIIRPALLLLCAWAFALSARAQIAVESFAMDEADLSARVTDARNDKNGKKCAIVKVVTSMQWSDCTFDTGIAGVVHTEQHMGEIWVWLPAGASRLTIVHKNYGDLRNYSFGAPLKEATVYIMRLKTPSGTGGGSEITGQYFVARCAVSGAMIEIEGYAREVFDDGVYNKYLPIGKYRYQVDAPRYQSNKGTFEITAQGKTEQNITLVPNFSKVTLTADGDIYINEEKKATNSWTGELTKGIYKVEVRKPSHQAVTQQLTVEANKDVNLKLPAPQPLYGMLKVESNREADIYIDGANTGQRSPDVIQRVPVGKHTVTLKATGYNTAELVANVQEGKLAEVTFSLVKTSGGTSKRDDDQKQKEADLKKKETEQNQKEADQKKEPKVAVTAGLFEMVYVQGGAFTMGCTSEQNDCDDDEKTTRRVTLSDYYIGKYEVTQAQWKAVMDDNQSSFKGDNLPVECVSWDDIQEFLRKLNAQTGKNYRLPTEAEWEFAARGGNKSKGYKYSGSNSVTNVAYYKVNSGKKTRPVGEKSANELGIYDMSGNVWEWCSDWYGAYSGAEQTDPVGAASGTDRVYRGGSWNRDAVNMRVADRNSGKPYDRDYVLGFRLACSVTAAERQADERKKQEIVDKFSMVYVQGSTFPMGCNNCDKDEKPVHKVTLSDFYISKYEVTQELWQAIMGDNPSHFKGDNLPVENVSWDEVQEFVSRLNRLTGKNYRLPTEAEWEYAARGGSKSGYYEYSGSNTAKNVAVYSALKTQSVGSKFPNELELFDMSGNVREWCDDRYGEYSGEAQDNPAGLASGADRVIRGGAYNSGSANLRTSARDHEKPDKRNINLGFRLAYSAKGAGSATVSRQSASGQNGAKTLNLPVALVYVQGGTFTMGCTSEQGGDCYDSENPSHSVTLSDFYIGKTEITQAQWKAVMGDNPSRFKDDSLPVENVSWNEVQDFIGKLNAQTGKNYRLPTEADWEYAARGGSKTRSYKYSGGNDIDNVAWYYTNSGEKTHPVGGKQANELGINDLSGNVSEWCSDWYGTFSSEAQNNPAGRASGSRRVFRGGNWSLLARSARVSFRSENAPDYRSSGIGFRLACDKIN